MKMNKRCILQRGDVLLYFFGRDFLCVRISLHLLSDAVRSLFQIYMLQPNQFYGLRICFGEIFEVIRLHIEFFLRKNLTAHQFQKAASGCFNVGGGVVRFGERLVKQKLVKLSKSGQFKLPAAPAGNLAELGGGFGTGVQNG